MLLLASTELSRNNVYLRQPSSKYKQKESAKCIRKNLAGAHFSGAQHGLFRLTQTPHFIPRASPELLQEHSTKNTGLCEPALLSLSMPDCFLLVLGRKWSEGVKQLQTESLHGELNRKNKTSPRLERMGMGRIKRWEVGLKGTMWNCLVPLLMLQILNKILWAICSLIIKELDNVMYP